jgi:hypothetical protein
LALAEERAEMIDEELVRRTIVTVAAMKLLLGRLYALAYRQMKLNPEDVPTLHEIMISNWSKSPLVKSSDPALSDVMSDDVPHEIERFLQGVEKDFRAMK